jgi:predicted Zn-dependent peptidase
LQGAALRADPAIRFGVLPNGMRYQILRNATPPHNASLRLRFDVGSMYERDDQHGLDQYEAVTPADLQNAARRFLVDAKAWKLAIVPAAKS